MDICSVSMIEDLILMTYSYPKVDTSEFILRTSQGLIKYLQTDKLYSKKVKEKLQLLTALLEYSTKHDASLQAKHIVELFRVWELVTNGLSDQQDCGIVNEFLIKCLYVFDDSMCQKCCSIIQALVANIFASIFKGSAKSNENWKNVLDLVEDFLNSTNIKLSNLQSTLLLKLCDMILSSYDVIVESTYLPRITSLLSSVLKGLKDSDICDTVWKKVFQKLIEKGLPYLKAKTSQFDFTTAVVSTDGTLQYCFVLLDILLEIAHSKDLIENGTDCTLESKAAKNIVCLLNHPITWVIVQCGLCHKKSFTRKQAFFSLKRALAVVGEANVDIKAYLCYGDHQNKSPSGAISNQKISNTCIFQWSVDGSDRSFSFWREFFLVFETLEENQLHVITPVLKKFPFLIDMTNCESKQDSTCIHTSWVCILLQRMMSHESKAVIREGVIMSLQLDPSVFPFLHQETGEEFLCSKNGEGLIPALQDVNLFCDFRDNTLIQPLDAESPIIAKYLKQFMERCCKAHPAPEKFLRFILKSLAKLDWGSVPLYYMTSALSNLPICSVWGAEELQILQNLIMKCLRTHDIRLRHITQGVLLRLMIKFTNCLEVMIEDILRLVMLCDIKKFFYNHKELWFEICKWMNSNLALFKNISHEASTDVYLFTMKNLEKYCSSSSDTSCTCDEFLNSSRPLALLLLILEQGQSSSIGEDFSNNILSWLNTVIEKSSTHLYMSKEKVHKTVCIINHIVTAWSKVHGRKDEPSTYNNLFKILRSLQSYIILLFPSRSASLEEANLCLRTWMKIYRYLISIDPKCDWPLQVVTQFSAVIVASQNILMNSKNGQHIGVKPVMIVLAAKCLSWICCLQEHSRIKFDRTTSAYISDFLRSLDLSAKLPHQNSSLEQVSGKIIEEYSATQWLCIPIAIHAQNLQKTEVFLDPLVCLEHFSSQLDTVNENNLPACLEALGALTGEALKPVGEEASSLICECLNISWKTVCSLSHSPSFWKAYKSFISAVLQTATLSQPNSTIIRKNIANFLSEITTQSISKPGLFQHAAARCIVCWTKYPDIDEHKEEIGNKNSLACKVAKNNIHVGMVETQLEFVVQCLTFSYMPKKEDLALLNVLKLSSHGNEDTSSSKNLSDHHSTLSTIVMLMSLDEKSQSDCVLGFSILKQLFDLDESITKKKSRYHHNSVQHHVKTKIYQAFILLHQYVPENEAEVVANFLIKSLQNDAQPSVRYFMEWALAVLIIKYSCLEKLLLDCLTCCECDDGLPGASTVGTAKFSAVCSYLTTGVLVGICKMCDKQEEYFLHLVDLCLPWCMSQHFSIRLYALAVVLRIKISFEEKGRIETLLNKHPALPSCLMFADKATGNVGKNWIKMKDNFFIFDLHPLKDLSIETVYVDVPRLCGMPNHVIVQELQQFAGSYATNEIPLYNCRDNLRRRTCTKWIPQESKQSSDLVLSQEDRYRKNYGAVDAADNVQKKIMPWLEAMDATPNQTEQKVRHDGLILVASLIDKPSNLGGLTRTCEIFGAEALVVQSLTCTSDKLYQSLSVTAHKWLPMKEVKPWQLEEFLPGMRKKGYTLIGTEQTAQSVCLSKYSFPKKCVIVLGHEKEGIPLSILKILDVCVQIPQKGIIRSLNVHVSGAITVWEYYRQHL